MRLSVFLFFLFLCHSIQAQIVSNFTANDEGWTVFSTVTGTSVVPGYNTTGGNPTNSGEITFAAGMTMTGVGYYWTAPAKFRGDLSASYNQTLSFDIHVSYPGSDNTLGDIIITNSAAGASLYHQLPNPPTYMGYSSFSFQLIETFSGWHYGSMTGPVPTSAQMKQVLSNITSFQIREKYYAGNSTFTVNGYLDNVSVGLAPPTVTSQPAPSQTVCDGATVLLSTSGTGYGTITYRWQRYNNATQQFSDLADNSTYSGTATNTLTINTTGMTAVNPYVYICKISGTYAADAYSNYGNVTVVANQQAPTATSAAGCNPSSVTLTAAGGSNGFYRWYTSSTGNTIIPGQQNSTYTTPTLTTTTTYYVSLTNGTCESARVPVTATINSAPTPTTTGASSCVPAALTLTAAGGTTYAWYTVSTGGTAIAGQTSSTYTTPVLNTTTTYYVSTVNGTCESSRTAVIATINATLTAPTVTGASGCPSTAITLTAAGGTDGQYRWYSVATGGTAISGQVNSTFTISTLTATTVYYVSINNGTCESARTSVTATVQVCGSNAPPEIQPATVQAPIEGKVSISLTALLSDPDNNIDLSSLKVTVQPLSGAKASIDGQRNLILDYTGISFSGTEKLTIQVCDLLSACTQKELAIDVVGDIIVHNAISPNNDGKNETFYIQFIDVLENTKKNHVSIFNRWGDLLFDVADYDNQAHVFKGLNNSGNEIPSGTYFYKIEFTNGKKASASGYLQLKK